MGYADIVPHVFSSFSHIHITTFIDIVLAFVFFKDTYRRKGFLLSKRRIVSAHDSSRGRTRILAKIAHSAHLFERIALKKTV